LSKHLVIPDCQVKPDVDLNYLTYIGKYAAEKKPDVIVCIGDFADMPSLSSYDVGTKSFEGRRYNLDIESVYDGMSLLMAPIIAEQERLKRNKEKQWKPRLVMTLGNHEDRITRAINNDPKLDGLIGIGDLGYESFGWEVHPFLQVVVIDGIAYSHYFTSGAMGRPIGSAQALLTKLHMSAFAGHQQGRQIAYGKRADGREMTSIICGSAYPASQQEAYLGIQGNQHWRGVYVLHEVHDGTFDEMAVSTRYLIERYTEEKVLENA
jgi:hypothetical protein